MDNWALVVVDCSSGRFDLKVCLSDLVTMEFVRYLLVCVSLFYVIDTGSIGSRARIEMGVTYLPFTVSSDAGYADLPLALLGAPVSIETLVKLGSRSLAKQDRD